MYGILTMVMILFGIISIYLSVKFKDYSGIPNMILVVIGIILICFCFLPSLIIYNNYDVPKIEAELNKECISQGYDTFESWKGVGVFPQEETYVKCKFVDNRQDIQGSLKLN